MSVRRASFNECKDGCGGIKCLLHGAFTFYSATVSHDGPVLRLVSWR